MKYYLLMCILLLSGCTTWECVDNSCISYYKASNKCAAFANAAYNQDDSYKIWKQCMRGEGYIEKLCSSDEKTQNPCEVRFQVPL